VRVSGAVIVIVGVVLIVLGIFPAWFRFHADARRHRQETYWPTNWFLFAGIALAVGGFFLRRA
jgi:uncharacterized membrane protein YidH (DUF202 family)